MKRIAPYFQWAWSLGQNAFTAAYVSMKHADRSLMEVYTH